MRRHALRRKAVTAVAGSQKTKTIELPPPNPEPDTFSSLCQDQIVKVDSNIYHLDRLRSSLKSIYLYKLFTTGDFAQKTDKVLEFKPKNAQVFPCVVELIHGKKLIDVLTKDNYLLVLESMEHLKMEINVLTVSRFIDEKLKSLPPQEAKIFELYDFIKKNTKFEYLLTSVLKYFSNHFTTIRNHEMLPSMPLDQFIQIIKNVPNVDDEKRYEIVQMCTKWLCHDFEKRLPDMTTLISSIKHRFRPEKEEDTNKERLANRIHKTNIREQAERKNIACCVFAMLAYDEVQKVDAPAATSKQNYKYSGKHRLKFPVKTPQDPSKILVNLNNEYDILRKFLKNGDLYDITVRVGDKTYKLHRAILEWKCSYFADIFRAEYAEAMANCDGTPTSSCPSKDKEYVLDESDLATFDAVINNIYFNKNIEWQPDGISRVFKIIDALNIQNLLESLKNWLEKGRDQISSQDVAELMNLMRGKTQFENLYSLYLCRSLNTEWPHIEQFCSVSWSVLENILNSSHLSLDDPDKILDICSAWVVHDVQNRYRFLPGIARIINPHCIGDEEFETGAPTADSNCSKQFIRDKLWEILSTLSYMVTYEQLSQIPVFVASTSRNAIDVLNADFDQIASFFSESINKGASRFDLKCASATMVGDILFVFWNHAQPCFLACNFSLKKCFELPIPIIEPIRYYTSTFTLLYCKNAIYCCSSGGPVMKFSMQFNRWIVCTERNLRSNCCFASDGEMLYKLDKSKEDERSYVVETYDFENNLWNCTSDIPPIKDNIMTPNHLTVVNDRDLAVVTYGYIFLFDRKSNEWCVRQKPLDLISFSSLNLFTQCEDKMLFVHKNTLYDFSPSNGNVELKKKLPSRYNSCGNILVIHRPSLCADQIPEVSVKPTYAKKVKKRRKSKRNRKN